MRDLMALIVILIFHSVFGQTTFYSKEDKICDPSNTGVVTYSGFRIHREYIVNRLNTPIFHFNSVSHCEHGTVDFERIMAVDRDTDIEFNKPFCLLKPNYTGTESKSVMNDLLPATYKIKKRHDHHDEELKRVLENLANGEFQIEKGRFGGTNIRRSVETEELDIYDYDEAPSVFTLFQQFDDFPNETITLELENIIPVTKNESSEVVSSYGAMTYVMDFAQGLISRMTTRKKITEYIGRKKFLTSKDFEVLTPPELSAFDFGEDLVCYNMVRRKKYAKRKMGLFAPYRFVGGLYECVISDEEKQHVIESYKTSLETPILKCDPELSVPISPLMSDDISKQWFQISSAVQMIHRVPYLYSPTSFDPRFQAIIKSSKFESWHAQLDPNEDYQYDDAEIGYITKVVTDTSNLVCKMLISMEKKLANEMTQMRNGEFYITRLLRNLQTRFLGVIGLVSEKDALNNLEMIEKTWDELNIT